MAVPSLNDNQLRAIADIIGDTTLGLTGTELSDLLHSCDIDDPEPSLSKRKRLFAALQVRQQRDRCANNVLNFIQAALSPVRFVGRSQEFERLRTDLNEALAFSGLFLAEDGNLKPVTHARTLSEAQERASRLRSLLASRNVHSDVLAFCRAELLQDNYFHAVFEATKSVAEKIRQRTGLTEDGAELVDRAFGINNPILAINTLRTETEESEQKGFANLIKGMFGTFRNVTAHAPKIKWPINEQDALDLLSLVSYMHRRIDGAALVPKSP